MEIYNNIKHAPNHNKYTRVLGHFEEETEKSILFSLSYGKVWLPKCKLVGVTTGMCGINYYVEKWVLVNNKRKVS